MSKPVVGYWEIRGFVMPIRYLLEYVGQEYEFKSYNLNDQNEWRQNDKQNLGLEFPNLPYFIDGDLKITQSNAIVRYLARKHGLIAKNDEDALEQDTIDGIVWDLMVQWSWLCYFTPDFDKELQTYRSGKLMPVLQQLDKHLQNRDYCVGNYLTYTDFGLYERLDGNNELFPNILDDYPNVKKFHERIGNLKGIKEFRNSKRFNRVLNADFAKWNDK
ncbi:glutathione S-transferase-like [Paramacrobiotus metropolitanus]|uniref:glutathione S-transferase-like n=1 Tax=Paramacrobiotus metropolitanus TaxID=2943436 RepID=UPI002445BCF7|nr:glutathione S-transferase-like [Paramacrobiotus metropolitanus]